MNRKTFIQAQGATCDNWTWSWSFVNHEEKFVIFGAWDKNTDSNKAMIFSQSWRERNGRKRAPFAQSLKHIHLIEEGGYTLKTFSMTHTYADKDEYGERAKIQAFTPKLEIKSLVRIGDDWYAHDSQIGMASAQEA